MIDEAQKAQTSQHFIVLSRRAMFHVTLCENRNLVKAAGKSYILGSSTHRAFFLTSLLSSWLCSQASIFRCQEKEKNMEVLKNSLFFFSVRSKLFTIYDLTWSTTLIPRKEGGSRSHYPNFIDRHPGPRDFDSPKVIEKTNV